MQLPCPALPCFPSPPWSSPPCSQEGNCGFSPKPGPSCGTGPPLGAGGLQSPLQGWAALTAWAHFPSFGFFKTQTQFFFFTFLIFSLLPPWSRINLPEPRGYLFFCLISVAWLWAAPFFFSLYFILFYFSPPPAASCYSVIFSQLWKRRFGMAEGGKKSKKKPKKSPNNPKTNQGYFCSPVNFTKMLRAWSSAGG